MACRKRLGPDLDAQSAVDSEARWSHGSTGGPKGSRGKAAAFCQRAKFRCGGKARDGKTLQEPEGRAASNGSQTGVRDKVGRKGRRDPFVSPIIGKMSSSTNCVGAGKRCLYIGDVRLLGIVQSSNGVIAVVASGRHTYFLREHDPLADGDVERITSDTITLRQRSSDVMGRPVMHEVTRKIGAPAV